MSYIILVNMVCVSYTALSHLACQARTPPLSNLGYLILLAYRFCLEQEPTQSGPRSEGRTGDFSGSGEGSQQKVPHPWTVCPTLASQVSQKNQILFSHSSYFLNDLAFNLHFPFLAHFQQISGEYLPNKLPPLKF